jgi:hypothetical protein
MRRIVLFLILVLILLAAIGFVVLGAFPPDPSPQPVERVLPNERFQTR